MKRILEQEEALHSVLSADRKTIHLIPTWQDTDVLQSINAALDPLATLTDLLSREAYVCNCISCAAITSPDRE